MEQKKNEGNPNLGQQTHSSPSEIGNHPHLNCPRCNSSNTKFCYYNNYILAQPRYYSRDCSRYWTHGGTQRNIPIGGNRKKCPSKTNPIAKISSGQTSMPLPPATPPPLPAMMGNKLYDGNHGIPFLPSIATTQAISQYGVDLGLFQARRLQSFKPQGSGNQFQYPGILFTAQENLMNPNFNTTGSSSFSALNQGPGDNHPGNNPSPQL